MWLQGHRPSLFALALLLRAWLAAGLAEGSTTARSSRLMTPPRLSRPASTLPWLLTAASRKRGKRQPPPSSACASKPEPSLWIPAASRAAALSLMLMLSACATWFKPEPSPQRVPVACGPSALERCSRPIYVLPDGPIAASIESKVRQAESAALDTCAKQHDALIDCVREHDEGH